MLYVKKYITSLSRKNLLCIEFCVIIFYCMNGPIEGRCTNYKNFSVCNSNFIARSVILEFFKVMYLPSIGPFMHSSKKHII